MNKNIKDFSDLDLGILYANTKEEQEKVMGQLSVITNELASRANEAKKNKMEEEKKLENTAETPAEEVVETPAEAPVETDGTISASE